MARAAALGVLLALGASASTALAIRAAPPPLFASTLARIREESEAIVQRRPPPILPPVPVVVSWRAQKQGSVELGAPLLATAAMDSDGDGIDELHAVTTAEVVVIAMRNGKPAITERIPFTGARAVPAPRDPVGTAYVDRGVLVVHASPWQDERRIDRRGGTSAPPAVSASARGQAFGVCPGERLVLVPGRNYFGDPSTGFVAAVRCRDDLVAADGQPLRVRAQLGVNHRLAVTVEICRGGACTPTGAFEYGGIGFAFALADVDRDGTPEVIVSGAGAPGDPDAVKVIELGGNEKKGLFRKAFTGGVAGVEVIRRGATAPAQVIAAVRLPGSTRIDLWSLD